MPFRPFPGRSGGAAWLLALLFRRGPGKLLDAVAITLLDTGAVFAAPPARIQKRSFIVVRLVMLGFVTLVFSLTL